MENETIYLIAAIICLCIANWYRRRYEELRTQKIGSMNELPGIAEDKTESELIFEAPLDLTVTFVSDKCNCHIPGFLVVLKDDTTHCTECGGVIVNPLT